jgi:hypothetical protein
LSEAWSRAAAGDREGDGALSAEKEKRGGLLFPEVGGEPARFCWTPPPVAALDEVVVAGVVVVVVVVEVSIISGRVINIRGRKRERFSLCLRKMKRPK